MRAGASFFPNDITGASLPAVADSLDIDAGDALAEALEKYECRITDTEDASAENRVTHRSIDSTRISG